MVHKFQTLCLRNAKNVLSRYWLAKSKIIKYPSIISIFVETIRKVINLIESFVLTIRNLLVYRCNNRGTLFI